MQSEIRKHFSEIRSKIIDSENETQPLITSNESSRQLDVDIVDVQQATKKDGEVRNEDRDQKVDDPTVKKTKSDKSTQKVKKPIESSSKSQEPKNDHKSGDSKSREENADKPKSQSSGISSSISSSKEIVKSKANNNSSEQFVANFVVQPEFHHGEHKSKLEFAPHFEHNLFEFMVPEGQNNEDSLVAIIQFYGRIDSNSLPIFKLLNDSQQWFSIGKVNHTMVSRFKTKEKTLKSVLFRQNQAVNKQSRITKEKNNEITLISCLQQLEPT